MVKAVRYLFLLVLVCLMSLPSLQAVENKGTYRILVFHEYLLDLHRRNMDCFDSSGIRIVALHHDYRHSFRKATFQDGSACSGTIRKGY